MVGGFFACLLAQAYVSEGYYISELGFTYWVVSATLHYNLSPCYALYPYYNNTVFSGFRIP